jgi:hypothetical protein
LFPYCSSCKAKKNLCGLGYCPIISNLRQISPPIRNISGNNETNTPPGIFVGNHGYPSVLAGPTALFQSDLFDYGKDKFGLGIEKVISLNSNVYRTASRMNVKTTENGFQSYILESASSTRSFEISFNANSFTHHGFERGDFFDTPVGPTAMVSNLKVVGNPKIPRIVDYIHEDPTLKASSSIYKLFRDGFEPEYLQNILAGGIVGVKAERKMVPTRWSITATDDIIFKQIKKEIIYQPWISEIETYQISYLGNNFQIILLPGPFSFEMHEQWNRGSLWGQGSVAIDYEGPEGRKKYADAITGAYYAARLSVVRYLKSIGKQASVIVLRTIGSEYFSPLGVWVIRSSVREAFHGNRIKFNTLEELMKDLSLEIPLNSENSKIVRDMRNQRRLEDYI